MIQPNVVPPIAHEIGLVTKSNYRLCNRYQTEVFGNDVRNFQASIMQSCYLVFFGQIIQ